MKRRKRTQENVEVQMTTNEIYNNEGFMKSENDVTTMKVNEIYETSSNPAALTCGENIDVQNEDKVVEKDDADVYTAVNKNKAKNVMNYKTNGPQSSEDLQKNLNCSGDETIHEVYTAVSINK